MRKILNPILRSFAVGYGASLGALFVGVILYIPFTISGTREPQLWRLLGEPVLLSPIIIGAVLGNRLARRGPLEWQRWAWVPNAAILLFVILTWKSYTLYSTRSDIEDAIANLFLGECGGNECLAPWFYTGPFYASIAFSIAAFLTARQQSIRAMDSKVETT